MTTSRVKLNLQSVAFDQNQTAWEAVVKKFMVLYMAPASAMEQMANATPEQAKAGMDAWMGWSKKAGSAVVDLGMPLGKGKTLSGKGVAGDSESEVTGFSIMQADTPSKLRDMLKSHPHLKMPGASIEVLEYLPLPGM
jgi:hypothetical protein